MQIIKTNHAAIFSTAFTYPMLEELAAFVDMTPDQIKQAASATLKGASKTVAALCAPKLRTMICKKLTEAQDYGAAFTEGNLEMEFTCLPDIVAEEQDIGNAGKNKSTVSGKRSHATGGKMSGAYTVNAKGNASLSAVEQRDAGRWEIVKHILACASVEEFAKVAPAKAIKKVGSLTTASSEFNYAVRSGWIVFTA
jgi:hypothetical protein